MKSWSDKLLIAGSWLCGLVLLVFFTMTGVAFYNELTSEKIEIRKDQWTCTESHKALRASGKTTIIVTICDNYRRTA